VVEDEATVLAVLEHFLRGLGYEALAAGTPAEARDRVEHLRSSSPGLKWLYMSGYTSNVIAQHGIVEEDCPFLSQPFTTRDLALKVREALDGGRGQDRLLARARGAQQRIHSGVRSTCPITGCGDGSAIAGVAHVLTGLGSCQESRVGTTGSDGSYFEAELARGMYALRRRMGGYVPGTAIPGRARK
jgi:hypothetical protein